MGLLGEVLNPFKDELIYRLKYRSENSEINAIVDNWNRIIGNKKLPFNNQPNSPRIVFFTGYGLSPSMLAIESVLIMSLYMRGCKISSIVCNKSLPCCEFNSTGNHTPSAGIYSKGLTQSAQLSVCNACQDNIRKIYNFLPIELSEYDQFITNEEISEIKSLISKINLLRVREFEYLGIKVGEEVFASVLRVTKRGTLDESKECRWLIKRYLLSCIMMVKICERSFKELKPDRIVMIHGVYNTHGIATRVANKHNIPVIIYGAPYRKNTIWLSHNESYHKTLISEPTSYWDNRELNESEYKETIEYLDSKRGGGRDYVSYHPNPIEDRETMYQSLGIDKSKKIVSLFTNVIWDAQIYYNFNVFESIFEWVFSSIEHLSKNKNIWLIIRIHPAEVKGGFPTKQPFLHEIKKRFPTLPDNVKVIPAESDLSSYTLAENSVAAIIYGTKMGLEIAARGVPVIVCGETFNRNKGFTIDITAKEQYFDLLNRIHLIPRMTDNEIQKAIKYAHYLYFRKMIDFPFVEIEEAHKSRGINLNLDSLEDLSKGKNNNLDTICEGIINLKNLFLN